MNPKLKKRLEKLLAMTKSSNEHEAANAESRIAALCVKHNVDIDQLYDESEAIETYWFRYDDANSKQVLLNVIWKASNINKTWKNKSKQRQVGVDCTASQAAEINLWWCIMRKAFKQHLTDVTNAFIIANELFGESSEHDDYEVDWDWDAIERQRELASSIKPTKVHKAITDETN